MNNISIFLKQENYNNSISKIPVLPQKTITLPTMHDSENQIFQLAAKFVNQTDRHIFLTGKAGTGKTTFLKYIHDTGIKKTVLVAPTGVAAINAGGVTIHSFFQLAPGTFLPVVSGGWNNTGNSVNTISSLLKNIKLRREKLELMQEMELLVIDEVSMVRADLLDAIDHVLRHVRKQHKPFGGVQVLYIGDLFQLPPVVTESDKNLLYQHYKSPFFFDAKVISQTNLLYLELKKIYRQSDAAFISLLNNIRNNEATQNDLNVLQTFYNPNFRPKAEDNFITLTSHNAKADDINQRELNALQGKLYPFKAEISGDFSERSFPAEETLHLKEGAQIMFIKNDKGEVRRYYNGKIGKIKSITGGSIVVGFPNAEADIELEKESWKNIRYSYNTSEDKIDEEELGEFKQYPIRLAWAITIHKSQGLTFDKAVIDAGASFAPGQVYVALSRLTNMQGLVLLSRIQNDCISTDEKVLEFCDREISADALQQQLNIDRKLYINTCLMKAFDWSKISNYLQIVLNESEGNLFAEPGAGESLERKWYEQSLEHQKVGDRFMMQLDKLLLQAETEGYTQLKNRTEAAVGYFKKSLEEQLAALQEYMDKLQSQKRISKFMKLLKKLKISLQRKMELLNTALQIATGLATGETTDNLLNYTMTKPIAIEMPEEPVIIKKEKVPKGTTQRLSLEMFKAGKTIQEIATERNLAVSTIETHLSSFIPTGEIIITELLPQEKIDHILNAIKDVPEGESFLTNVKQKLGDEYSYGEIRAALEYKKSGVGKA